MKLRDLHIVAYGCLVDFHLPDLPPGLVIVHGPNEAGKSTLFSLLTTLIYGFHPPTNFPYVPWHNNPYPEFTATLTRDDDSEVKLMRKLMSKPIATLEQADDTQKLNNRPLPFATHISRPMHDALYALTTDDMRLLKGEPQAELDDRLLGGLTADVLQPVRKVIRDLTTQADGLWRQDRRGAPRCKMLKENLRTAKAARKHARASDANTRDADAELHKVETKLARIQDDLDTTRIRIRRAEKLLPVRNKLRQIESETSQIAHPDAVAALPSNVEGRSEASAQAVAEAEAAVAKLNRERPGLDSQVAMLTDTDLHTLAHADAIDTWTRHIAGHEKEKADLTQLARDAKHAWDSACAQAAEVMQQPWAEEHVATLDAIVLPDLRDAVLAFGKTEQRVEQLENVLPAVTAPAPMPAALPWWPFAVLATAGLALMAVDPLWGILTLCSAAVGSHIFAIGHQRRKHAELGRPDTSQHDAALVDARKKRATAAEHVAGMLSGLPVADSILARPTQDLHTTIKDLLATSAQWQQKSKEHTTRLAQWQTQQSDLDKLLTSLDTETLKQAEALLSQAQQHRSAHDIAAKSIEKLTRDIADETQRLIAAQTKRDALLAAMRQAVGDGAPADLLLSQAADLQRRAERIRNSREELASDHSNLADICEEIRILDEADEAWTLDAEHLERDKARQEELHDEKNGLVKKQAELRKDIEAGQAQVSAGECQGEIDRIREEMADLARERDRLALLASLLQRADRDFREQHQPDVLKRAGEHLRAITAERYRSLATLLDNDGNERLAVIPKKGEPRPVGAPLSRGTLDQIHLAFRLAVIDHLDEGHETLPLLLDETLVNWDDMRLDQAAEILKHMADRRQVFLFTCHEWIAEKLHNFTGAPVHRLPQ